MFVLFLLLSSYNLFNAPSLLANCSGNAATLTVASYMYSELATSQQDELTFKRTLLRQVIGQKISAHKERKG